MILLGGLTTEDFQEVEDVRRERQVSRNNRNVIVFHYIFMMKVHQILVILIIHRYISDLNLFTSDRSWYYDGHCATENCRCSCNGMVKFGKGHSWTAEKRVYGSILCKVGNFGDPLPGIHKECYCRNSMSILFINAIVLTYIL